MEIYRQEQSDDGRVNEIELKRHGKVPCPRCDFSLRWVFVDDMNETGRYHFRGIRGERTLDYPGSTDWNGSRLFDIG